jgi:hypothetical protein
MPIPVLVPGMCWICRMCQTLAEAVDKGSESCLDSFCGGPAQGRSFPHYRGPLLSSVSNYCYLCGEDSDRLLAVGLGRVLGICRKCSDAMVRRATEE